ncbi:hypothetical protein ACOME3_001691 [Neoechinorhynchus agilis]
MSSPIEKQIDNNEQKEIPKNKPEASNMETLKDSSKELTYENSIKTSGNAMSSDSRLSESRSSVPNSAYPFNPTRLPEHKKLFDILHGMNGRIRWLKHQRDINKKRSEDNIRKTTEK